MEGFSDTTVCIKYFWSTPLSQRLAIPLHSSLVITVITILPPATETRMGKREEEGEKNSRNTTEERVMEKKTPVILT